MNFYNLKRNFTYMDDAGDETFSFLCNESDTSAAVVVSYWLSHIFKFIYIYIYIYSSENKLTQTISTIIILVIIWNIQLCTIIDNQIQENITEFKLKKNALLLWKHQQTQISHKFAQLQIGVAIGWVGYGLGWAIKE